MLKDHLNCLLLKFIDTTIYDVTTISFKIPLNL